MLRKLMTMTHTTMPMAQFQPADRRLLIASAPAK